MWWWRSEEPWRRRRLCRRRTRRASIRSDPDVGVPGKFITISPTAQATLQCHLLLASWLATERAWNRHIHLLRQIAKGKKYTSQVEVMREGKPLSNCRVVENLCKQDGQRSMSMDRTWNRRENLGLGSLPGTVRQCSIHGLEILRQMC
jgi:hypothetical protein